MASSTTIQSPSNEQTSFPKCLSTVNAGFVSSKLWGDKESNNYSWKEQMLCLIESLDSLGFIDGNIPPPPQGSTVEYHVFRRSDRLLEALILSALSNTVVQTVADCATARDVWLQLEKNFSEFVQSSNIAGQRDLNEYLPLYKATLHGNWDAIEQILHDDPDAAKARINSAKQSALHVAVATHKPYHFVEKLAALMSNDELIAFKDDGGNTALSIAAANGYKEAAILLVNRMENLLYIPDSTGNFPIQQAAQFAHKGMLEYLIRVTKDDRDTNPYAGIGGLRLLIYVIDANFLDVAIRLVEKYPHVATLKLPDNTSALKKIAENWSLFFSSRRDFALLDRILELTAPTSWKIKEHQQLQIPLAIQLIKYLCKRMESMSHKEAADIYVDAIMKATELGSYVVVEQILEAFPDAIYCSTHSTKQSIFHIAVQNRSIDVFNLIYQKKKSDHKHLYLDHIIDFNGNNLLHVAAKLAPSHKLDEVSGAALQMQREISWYKAMERNVHPNCGNQLNKAGKTPKMIFVEEHKKLKEEAEKWTKDTVNSCMVVAALIAGASFAGAITAPGGYDNSSGYPIFVEKFAFMIYQGTNTMSFMMSTICLLLLLFMLITRYADEDFLTIIPYRLMMSLVTLFISAASMLVSFFAAIFVVSKKRDNIWDPQTAQMMVLFTCLPLVTLLLLGLGPLRHYFSGAYGFIKYVKKTNHLS